MPIETNFKTIGEQIEYNKTDEIEIIFLTLYLGMYRFKIVIDYSIKGSKNSIESNEFDLIALEPSSIPYNSIDDISIAK